MPLEPVVKQSVSDAVFQQLSAQVLTGELAPGDVIASERSLTEIFGVNRQAVREALKRLQQAGLVRISQGDATTVLDYRQTAGLDLLPMIAASATAPSARPDVAMVEVLRSSMEMRQCIGADAAALCAQRAIPPLPGRLLDLVAAMDSAPDDPLRLQPLSEAFWELLVDGSANIAYRLALNTLNASARYHPALAFALMTDELSDRDGYRGLARAIDAGDWEGAQMAAHDLLGKGVAAVERLLSAAIDATKERATA